VKQCYNVISYILLSYKSLLLHILLHKVLKILKYHQSIEYYQILYSFRSN